MAESLESTLISLDEIDAATETLKNVATRTPLLYNPQLSAEYDSNIWLKREDLQVVRSYKIRGAYNKIDSLSEKQLQNGVVCASAGNHAQGVALACSIKKIKGIIFMPETTSNQKVKQVKMFGKEFVSVVLEGDTYDDSFAKAKEFCDRENAAFIPPFDDYKVIAGQATVGKEIFEDSSVELDYILIPIGGGGLAAGIGSYFKQCSPSTKLIGIEPAGAPSMQKSLAEGKVITLENIDKFVDGAAVQRVGDITYEICKNVLTNVITTDEGKICGTIFKLYNEQAIVVEPAGALTITALDDLREKIKGKNVVCVVSGSNNDITRTPEIRERSQLYKGLKHYFIIDFPQRAGALREFLNDVLGPDDDITYFEYSKKINQDVGPALISIELQKKEDFEPLLSRMIERNIKYEYVNEKPRLFRFLT